MQYSELSNFSKICFGCEALGGQDWGKINLKDIEQAIEESLDLGINFFDTADVYGLGLSEQRLSKILGSRRFDMIIATKGGVQWFKKSKHRARTVYNSSPEYITSSVESSLTRLRLDVLPVYYVHWPDPNIEIKKTFECLAALQSKGKISMIGCSNFNENQISQACEVSNLSLVQLPLNLIGKKVTERLKILCQQKNLKIIAYNSLASGLLSGKFDLNSKFSDNDRRSRLEIFNGKHYLDALESVEKYRVEAIKEGLSLSQYAIKWTLENDFVESVIVGIKNSRQAQENISIFT